MLVTLPCPPFLSLSLLFHMFPLTHAPSPPPPLLLTCISPTFGVDWSRTRGFCSYLSCLITYELILLELLQCPPSPAPSLVRDQPDAGFGDLGQGIYHVWTRQGLQETRLSYWGLNLSLVTWGMAEADVSTVWSCFNTGLGSTNAFEYSLHTYGYKWSNPGLKLFVLVAIITSRCCKYHMFKCMHCVLFCPFRVYCWAMSTGDLETF